MDPEQIKLAKGITKFVVTSSVGLVVSKAVKSHVSPKNALQAVQIAVGSYALAGMVSDQAGDWAGTRFDDALETVQKIKTALKENADK